MTMPCAAVPMVYSVTPRGIDPQTWAHVLMCRQRGP